MQNNNNSNKGKHGGASSSYAGGSVQLVYPPPQKAISLAIASDTIRVSHSIQFCKPTPIDSYNCLSGVPPAVTACGVFTRDLKDFPAGDLPSGGACTTTMRISPSEMVYGFVRLDNYDNPWSGTVVHTWWNKNTNLTLYSTPFAVPSPDPTWVTWWHTSWSIAGHFSWEIDRPGDYQWLIQTTWGDATVDFTVTDSSCTDPVGTFVMG